MSACACPVISVLLRSACSDRFAEVADGLEVGVHRGEPLRHRAGLVGDHRYPPAGGDQGLVDGPEVEDDPEQAHRRDRDDQRGDDQGHPGGCWHGRCPFCRAQPRRRATEPAYRTAPTLTSSMVLSVVASASGKPSSSPTSATPPARTLSLAARIRSSAASTRLSSQITTGSTTTSRMTLPIHHSTMACSPQLAGAR